MTVPIERFLVDGQRLDARVERRIVDGAELLRTMQGAASLTLPIFDPDYELQRSGVLTRRRARPSNQFDRAAWSRLGKVRGTLDGQFLRLAGVARDEDILTLTWEDEIAALLRAHDDPFRASRSDLTRAEFVYAMVRQERSVKIPFWCPQLGRRQTIAPLEGDDDVGRGRRREKGIAAHALISVKGVQATREQRELLNRALRVADEEDASTRATLALIEALIEESLCRNLTGGDADSVGPLQLRAIHLGGSTSMNGGRRDVELVVRLFLTKGFWGKGGAIANARNHGDWTPGEVAQSVQGSAPARYENWRTEAEVILEAFGGMERTRTVRESYNYQRGGDDGEREDSWECSGRLANEVHWRRFAAENILYFCADEDLFRSKPRFLLDPQTTGVLRLNFDVDYGKPASKATAVVRARRWAAPPGTVIELADYGLIDGRWLVDTISQDPHSPHSEIELRRPTPDKPEPAPRTRTITLSDEEATGGRAAIVQAAKKALRTSNRYRYARVRPMPDTLFPSNFVALILTDCSGFATLCYKAAGAPDPNGLGYNGAGWTGTLAAHGRRTNDPQPGDLCFYGTAPPFNHVAVYIGGGDAIGFGSNPIKRHTAKANIGGPFAGFYTYDTEG